MSNQNKASVAENSVLANDKGGFPFKKVFFGILVALVVISLILLVINLVVNSYFSKVTVFEGEWEVNTAKMKTMPIYQDNAAYFTKNEELHKAYDAALLNYAQASSDIRYDENVYNYAILGTDQFGENDKAQTDIIMVASVDKDKDYVTYLSFETKMLVYIPSVGVGPLCDAYLLGGPRLLTDTLEQNYGIQINGFVELDMSAFIELINEFGPVEFDAKDQAFVDKLNGDIDAFNTSKKLTGDKAAKKVTAKNGKVTLDGLQTLAYLRNADSEKSKIANSILSQLTSKITEKGLGGAKTTLDVALEKMTVALSRDDAGAIITMGMSIVKEAGPASSIPVGNMEGRTQIVGAGYTCNYQAERAAVIKAIYGE